jgi:hypothetical protein
VSASIYLSVYDGRYLIGSVVDDGNHHRAFNAQGLTLGKFRSRRAAIEAINVACKPDASPGNAT